MTSSVPLCVMAPSLCFSATDAAGSAAPGTTVAPDGNAAATVAGGEDSASAVSSQGSSFPVTIVTIPILLSHEG